MNEPADLVPLSIVTDRLRFLAVVLLGLFLCGWIAWFAPYEDLLDRSRTPLGADFAMFYVAGQVVADGNVSELYNQAEHQERLHTLFPDLPPQFCLPYRYPPHVALAAAPLSRLPYVAAYALFILGSLLLIAASLRTWLPASRLLNSGLRPIVLLGMAACPVILENVIGGQASLISCAIAASVIALMRRSPGWAGVILALALFKPNVLALFAVGCVVAQPKILRGAIPTAAVLVICSWWVGGWSLLREYLHVTTSLAGGTWDVATPYWKVHSLASQLPSEIPHVVSAITGLGILLAVWIGMRWRSRPLESSDRFLFAGLLLVVNSVCNPYTPIYDLTLLVVASLSFLEFACRQLPAGDLDAATLLTRAQSRGLQLAVATLYFGPHLSQAAARLCGIQFFSIVLATTAAVALAQTVTRSRGERRTVGVEVGPGLANSSQEKGPAGQFGN